MIIRVIILSVILIYTNPSRATVFARVENTSQIIQSRVFLIEGQSVNLSTDKFGYWVKVAPELREYDNLKNGIRSIESITYNILPLETICNDEFITINNLKPGTYFFGCLQDTVTKIITTKPIQFTEDNIIQVIVRRDNTYIGFITEQLNLPFIIPPKFLNQYGHQTDLNIGTDCAELAIYGMRRLGQKIPYVGPRGITEYLIQTDSIYSGIILHYGFQVSILYEDRGVVGELDSDDLLIHAYEDKVKIEPLSETKLLQMKCKKYKWNIPK